MFFAVFLASDCSGWLVLPLGVGFFLGLVLRSRDDLPRRSYVSAVLVARYSSEHPSKQDPLPLVPRCIMFSVGLLGLSLVKGWCPGFLSQHALLALGFLTCGLSAASFLLVAYTLQSSVEEERKARIDQFMTSPEAPVPPPVESIDAPPTWLTAWNLLNIALFVLLVAALAVPLIRLAYSN